MKLRIGSRASQLAVAQSELVMAALRAAHPEIELELVTMHTTGDKILDRSLDAIGGKGLFVRELDAALLEGRVDLTVHSCKDLPMEENPDIPLLGFTKREDPHDVLVLPQGKTEIDFSRPIGCSSLRRQLQLKALFPQAELAGIRGNLQTRIGKLDRGEFGAIVLACAGMNRMGYQDRIARRFTFEEILPAAGQGIIAIQGRADFDTSLLQGIDDPDGHCCALTERAFVRTLDGGCTSPVAAFAQISGDDIRVDGFYVNSQGLPRKAVLTGKREQGPELGAALAKQMKEAD